MSPRQSQIRLTTKPRKMKVRERKSVSIMWLRRTWLFASAGLLYACGDSAGPDGLDVGSIPGDYAAIFLEVETIFPDGTPGGRFSLIGPDSASVFDIEFTADGRYFARVRIPGPVPAGFAEFAWGGPPPFDTTASGTWDLREDGIHLNGAGIQFLKDILFDSNGGISINEYGVSPTGMLSFEEGECLGGRHGLGATNHELLTWVCRKGSWQVP